MIYEHLEQNANGFSNFTVDLINTGKFKHPTPNATIDKICHGEGSMIYAQIACTYKPEELQRRKLNGLLVGCITIFVSLFLTIYNNYLDKIFKFQQKLYDVETVSAADYTVEMEIKKDLYDKAIERDKTIHNEPDAVYFREWLTKEIEQRLSRMPQQGPEHMAGNGRQGTHVVNITFTYENAEMINLLRERGEKIKESEWEEAKKVEEKMDAFK